MTVDPWDEASEVELASLGDVEMTSAFIDSMSETLRQLARHTEMLSAIAERAMEGLASTISTFAEFAAAARAAYQAGPWEVVAHGVEERKGASLADLRKEDAHRLIHAVLVSLRRRQQCRSRHRIRALILVARPNGPNSPIAPVFAIGMNAHAYG